MTYLARTNGTATSTTTFTISAWVKRSELGGDRYVFAIANNDGSGPSEHIHLRFSTDTLQAQFYISSSQVGQIETNAKYRDPSAWYHIVFRFDSTQASANNRMRLYINGEYVDQLGINTQPSQSASCAACSGGRFSLSTSYSGTGGNFKGYIGQFIYADGQSYAPSTFGSTNSDGIWVPNTSPSVTYGNNGFKLDFANSGAAADANGFGADTSGNGNNLASTSLGTYPNTTDTPHNVFCTLNPLAINKNSVPSVTYGNLKITDTNNNEWRICGAGQGFTSGKWYWETKYIGPGGSLMTGILDINNYEASKVFSTDTVGVGGYPGRFSDSQSFGYRDEGTIYHNGNSTAGKTTWSSAGDILGLAVDMDNKAVYAHVNGTYVDSGDPTSGASRTGSLFNFTPTNFVTPAVSVSAASSQGGEMNFGNPTFAISSSNADANGYGKFEFAVPSGYYAICTENLAQYG